MNTYRVLSVVGESVHGAAEGTEVDLDLSVLEEKDAVEGGHLELVPRTYKQLSDNYSAAKQGGTFEAAFLVEHEAALISGGHIERAEPVTNRKRKG